MQLEVGTVFEGKITGITKFGAFVELPEGKTGMVHISEVASTFVKEINDFVKKDQVVKVKVISIGEGGKVALSMKKAEETERQGNRSNAFVKRPGNFDWQSGRKADDADNFEDMMSKFKKASDEKMSDLKKYTESKRGSYSRRSN